MTINLDAGFTMTEAQIMEAIGDWCAKSNVTLPILSVEFKVGRKPKDPNKEMTPTTAKVTLGMPGQEIATGAPVPVANEVAPAEVGTADIAAEPASNLFDPAATVAPTA